MNIYLSPAVPESYYLEDESGTYQVPAVPGGWARRRRFTGSVKLMPRVRQRVRKERICREIGRS